MLAGAEFGSHLLKCWLGERYERVSAAEPAPRGPLYLLEHRHALAEIAARGAVVPAEGLAVCRRRIANCSWPTHHTDMDWK